MHFATRAKCTHASIMCENYCKKINIKKIKNKQNLCIVKISSDTLVVECVM